MILWKSTTTHKILDSLPGAEYMISAISDVILEKIYSLSQIKTGGLAHKLTIKLQAKVMLTLNIYVSDKLCNGKIGTIHHLKQDSNSNVTNANAKALMQRVPVLLPLKDCSSELF